MGRHRPSPASRVPARTGAALAAVLGAALLALGLDLLRQGPAVPVAPLSAQQLPGTAQDIESMADPLAQRLPAVAEPAASTVRATAPASPAPASPAPPTLASPNPTPPPPTPLSLTAPIEVVFHAEDTTARVIPVGVLASGALQLPDDPTTLGWWSAGALPGEDQGTVVVAGHVDSGNEVGVLSLLPDLAAGDVVTVVGEDAQQQSYAVVSRESAPKAALDPALFARGGPHRLALITCGGRFDPGVGAYEDNVVVLAEPLAD